MPLQAPNRELNDSARMLVTFPSSFWVSVPGVKATPPVSCRRACVYHPGGVEKLHPVLLNATGFSLKVTVKEDVGGGAGGGVGDVELF